MSGNVSDAFFKLAAKALAKEFEHFDELIKRTSFGMTSEGHPWLTTVPPHRVVGELDVKDQWGEPLLLEKLKEAWKAALEDKSTALGISLPPIPEPTKVLTSVWKDENDPLYGPFKSRQIDNFKGECFKCGMYFTGSAEERVRGGTLWNIHAPSCPTPTLRKKR